MNTYKQFEGKKASFEDMLTAEDQNLHNSNMLNLVSAVRKIDDELEWLAKRKEDLTVLRGKITDFANSGNVTNTDKVSELFKEQSKGGNWSYKSW